MDIIINWETSRDPMEWVLHDRIKPITIPSRWPKGQCIFDRLYWLDIATSQASRDWATHRELTRLNGLFDAALGMLARNIDPYKQQ